uniref:Uncharacterized protein n=1 Tax=Panagrolaimus sp. JU765 TaxID=591449 RepID=A0AC34RT48_9BILA
MVLTAVGQLVSDQDAHLSESDYLAREILLVSPGCMSMQMLMIYIGFKFREFLKRQTAFGNGFESIRPVFIFQNDVNQSLPNEIKEP